MINPLSLAALFTTVVAPQIVPGTGAGGKPPVQAPNPQPQGTGRAVQVIEQSIAPIGAIKSRERLEGEVSDRAREALARTPGSPGVVQIVERHGVGVNSIFTVSGMGYGTPLEAMVQATGPSIRAAPGLFGEATLAPVSERFGIYTPRNGRSTIIGSDRINRAERNRAVLRAVQTQAANEDQEYARRREAAKSDAERRSLDRQHEQDVADRRDRQAKVERFQELRDKAENGTATEAERQELTEAVNKEERKQNVARVAPDRADSEGDGPEGWDEQSMKGDPIGYLLAWEHYYRNKPVNPREPYIRLVEPSLQATKEILGRIEKDTALKRGRAIPNRP